MPYKPPPQEQDDEEREPLENMYPASHRRRVVIPKRPAIDYYADEHPEIPRIRRATRYLDQQQTDQLHQTTQGTASRKKRLSEDRGIAEPSTEKRMIAPRQVQVPDSASSPGRQATYSPARYTKIQRAAPRRFRFQHSYLDQVYALRHNPAAIIIGVLALIVLILTPVLVNASHSSTGVNQNNAQNGNGQSITGVSQVPLNAHELVIMPQDTDHPAPPVFAQSAYLLDADTGVTLYAYNPFTHLPMLSTTKLMTASLAIEHGNLDQKITINAAMERDISKLSADSALFGVKKGETYTLRDILYGLLFVSGNDAAIVIADALAGNVQNFVAEMNQKAHQLGMNDTHFMNPHGLLQAGQYSCAHDLAILGKYSMSLPVLHKMSGETVHQIPQGGNHPVRLLLNENQFLWWYPGTDGGKTGYDGQSDFIQVMSVTRNHHHLIGVVMHTVDWWTDMRDLMNWGLDSFKWISPHDLDSPSNPIPYDNLWNYFARDKQTNTIPTADHGRYYIYTGYSISGLIMDYFDKHGGLGSFGYPVRLPTLSSGPSTSQQFQHAVIQCDLTSHVCQTR
ncbi:MAG TPA: D-alanyl-D-alanine carboxypeptidase family protein [Ktedonobacteraceae bacterium]|nr:D-alanyl-D-alanine carboxypeptidase family protein [Ktedonobacteraceae bacterium]